MRAAGATIGLLCGAVSQAQVCGEWVPTGGLPGVDGRVSSCVVWDADGSGPEPESLIVSGNFRIAGDVAVRGLALWDGTRWYEFGNVSANDFFDAAAMFVHGGELFAARFNGVYRLVGGRWERLGPSINSVRAITEYGGEIVIGGVFTSIDGASINHVARWDGTAWRPLGTGVDGTVLAFREWNGELLVGGQFLAAGGSPVNLIAAWNGATWHALGGGIARAALGDSVNAITEFEGRPVVSTTVPSQMVARWDGEAWIPLDPTMIGIGNDVAVIHGNLYGVGWFRSMFRRCSAGGYMGPALWTGTQWQPLISGDNSINTWTQKLIEYRTQIWSAGMIPSIGGKQFHNIARWDGTQWRHPGGKVDGRVACFLPDPGGLIAGGSFQEIAGIGCLGIARRVNGIWQPIGGGIDNGDLAGSSCLPTPASVEAVARWNGGLAVAGQFSRAGGVPARNIAFWNGQVWSGMGTVPVLNPAVPVKTLAVFNGDLIIGGRAADGAAAGAIARWDGAAWQVLGGGVGHSAPTNGRLEVGAMTLYEGNLVVAGNFTLAGETTVAGVAQWDGARWRAMGALPRDLVIRSLIVIGGRLYASGLGIWQWDGVTWTQIGDQYQMYSWGVSIAEYQGELVAGDGAGRALRRVEGAWRSLGYASTAGAIGALAQDGQSLLAGGNFVGTFSGIGQAFLAEWRPGEDLRFETGDVGSDADAGHMLEVTVGACGPEAIVFRWYRNGIPLAPGATPSGAIVSFNGTRSTSTLTISGIQPSDAGIYACEASDSARVARSGDIQVRVRCPADIGNGIAIGHLDFAVTLDDLLYFLDSYQAGNFHADVDDGSGTGTRDSAVTLDDLLYFLVRYELGC
jgi:hypothetical protein